MCCPFPTKQRRYVKERDDLSLPIVPGGVEIGFGYRKLRPRAEDTPLGARPLLERLGHWDGHTDPGSQELGARGPPRVNAPPVSAVQRTTGPSGERGYGGGMVLVAYAGPVRPAAALRDSVLCLPTDIHSLFVNKPSSSSSSSSYPFPPISGGI